MKKGISMGAFTPAPCAENFALVKKFGFDGAELMLEAEGELGLSSSDSDILKLGRAAADAGIELYSVTTGLFWEYAMTSTDKAEREKAKSVAKKQIEAAALLGCDTVLVVPGATGVDFAPSLGVTDYSDAYGRAMEAVKELAPFAEEHRVSIGVENVWNKFLTSPLEMQRFIDEVGSPYVGSYFDVGNVLVNSYPEHWIKALGSRIKKVHFKDFKRCIGNLDGFCDLLAGDVDYAAVMQAFREVGYDGWVTAEVFPYRAHNDVMLAHTSMAMDKILGRNE